MDDDLDTIRERYNTMTNSDWLNWAITLGLTVGVLIAVLATA